MGWWDHVLAAWSSIVISSRAVGRQADICLLIWHMKRLIIWPSVAGNGLLSWSSKWRRRRGRLPKRRPAWSSRRRSSKRHRRRQQRASQVRGGMSALASLHVVITSQVCVHGQAMPCITSASDTAPCPVPASLQPRWRQQLSCRLSWRAGLAACGSCSRRRRSCRWVVAGTVYRHMQAAMPRWLCWSPPGGLRATVRPAFYLPAASLPACPTCLPLPPSGLQVEADDLTQRCTQLHDDNLHMTSVLAQREHELLGGWAGGWVGAGQGAGGAVGRLLQRV